MQQMCKFLHSYDGVQVCIHARTHGTYRSSGPQVSTWMPLHPSDCKGSTARPVSKARASKQQAWCTTYSYVQAADKLDSLLGTPERYTCCWTLFQRAWLLMPPGGLQKYPAVLPFCDGLLMLWGSWCSHRFSGHFHPIKHRPPPSSVGLGVHRPSLPGVHLSIQCVNVCHSWKHCWEPGTASQLSLEALRNCHYACLCRLRRLHR